MLPARVVHQQQHRFGILQQSGQALARELSRDGLAGQLHANVAIELVDLAQSPSPAALERWQSLGQTTLPWLVINFPKAARLPDAIVSAPLSEAAMKRTRRATMEPQTSRKRNCQRPERRASSAATAAASCCASLRTVSATPTLRSRRPLNTPCRNARGSRGLPRLPRARQPSLAFEP